MRSLRFHGISESCAHRLGQRDFGACLGDIYCTIADALGLGVSADGPRSTLTAGMLMGKVTCECRPGCNAAAFTRISMVGEAAQNAQVLE